MFLIPVINLYIQIYSQICVKIWNGFNMVFRAMGETDLWKKQMRSSLVVRASDCQCTSCNGPGFDPSIRRHSGIWGAADEAVLNIVRKKKKKKKKKQKAQNPFNTLQKAPPHPQTSPSYIISFFLFYYCMRWWSTDIYVLKKWFYIIVTRRYT